MKCPSCGKEMKKVKKNYKYVDSGLNNVILTGIGIYECKCGEEIPEIKNIERINKRIANALVLKTALLSGKEFRFIRKQLGLKEKDIALLLGVDPVSISRWENSNAKIGMSNDKLMRMLYVQALEEQSNKVSKGIVNIMPLIKRTEKQQTIKISYESVITDNFQMDDEYQLAQEIKTLMDSTTEIALCENISKIIKDSGLSEHPLVQVLEQLPKKLCPVVFKDMLKEQMKYEVNTIVDELFERRTKSEMKDKQQEAPRLLHGWEEGPKCPLKTHPIGSEKLVH